MIKSESYAAQLACDSIAQQLFNVEGVEAHAADCAVYATIDAVGACVYFVDDVLTIGPDESDEFRFPLKDQGAVFDVAVEIRVTLEEVAL